MLELPSGFMSSVIGDAWYGASGPHCSGVVYALGTGQGVICLPSAHLP